LCEKSNAIGVPTTASLTMIASVCMPIVTLLEMLPQLVRDR